VGVVVDVHVVVVVVVVVNNNVDGEWLGRKCVDTTLLSMF